MREDVLEGLRKLKAEGKEIPRMMEKELEREEARRAADTRNSGKTKLAAALYLLGASLSQIAQVLEVQRGTVWSYVRNHVSEGLRVSARNARGGRYATPLDGQDIDAYVTEFSARRGELRELNAIEVAKTLKESVTLPDRSEEE